MTRLRLAPSLTRARLHVMIPPCNRGRDAPPSDDVEIATAERRLSHGSCCRNPRACHLPRRARVCFHARPARRFDFADRPRSLFRAVLLGRRGRPRADRLRLCPLPRRRHHPVMVSAGMDAPHRGRADVAGKHCCRRRLHSGRYQAGAQASDAGRGQDLGLRAPLRQWRSRRHHPVRRGARLGGVRPDFVEAAPRCRGSCRFRSAAGATISSRSSSARSSILPLALCSTRS